MRLLLDLVVAGEERALALEALAADRLFVHLAGGMLPSIDAVYRDLPRFDAPALASLEAMMAGHGLRDIGCSHEHVHVDLDTTVEPLFGSQGGCPAWPQPALSRPQQRPPQDGSRRRDWRLHRCRVAPR